MGTLKRLAALAGHWHGCRQHGHDQRVFAVEHHQTLLAKDMGLCIGISLHAAMPVQMVLRDIEHRRCRGFKTMAIVELKAGQLQHPGLGQCLGINALGQGIEQAGANIARHAHAQTSMFQQLPRQRGNCGLAVGAGNAKHLGRIAMGLAQTLEGMGKQIQLATNRQTDAARCGEYRRHAVRAQTRRAIDGAEILAINQRGAEFAHHKAHAGQLCLQSRQKWRSLARISHDNFCARPHAPACHGDTRDAQPQNQHTLTLQMLGSRLWPMCRHRWQLYFFFFHSFGLLLDLSHVGIAGVRDAGVGKNLCHKGRSISGRSQGREFRNRLGIQCQLRRCTLSLRGCLSSFRRLHRFNFRSYLSLLLLNLNVIDL